MAIDKLTDQEQMFIDRFLEHSNPYQAAEEAGYVYNNGMRLLKRLTDQIIDQAKSQLVEITPKAIGKLKNMLDEGATEAGATLRMEAIKQILDRVGIIKKEKVEFEGAVSGIFIIPKKDMEKEI